MNTKIYDLLRLNFTIYPGVSNFKSAHFLKPYYELHRQNQGFAGKIGNCLVYAGFRIWMRRRVKTIAAKWGLDEAWQKHALAICRERFVDPREIALYRIQSADEMDYYLRRFEHVCVGRTIANPATDHGALLRNKARFYAHCQKHAISHPQMVMRWSDGSVEFNEAVDLNRCGADEFFVKPASGTGGMGTFTFRLEEGEGAETGLQRLATHLAANCTGEWVVQPRMKAHPELAIISCNALPTARIITLINEKGEPEIVSTVLRIAATEDAIVDNILQGGLSAAIDLDTGVLSGSCSGNRSGEHPIHPISKVPINGRVVPDWEAAKALALKAHSEMMQDYVLIGWDVGMTNNGPVLVEANPRPCTILMQRPTRTPVGKTRMGELIAWHLEQRLREGHHRSAIFAA